MLLANSHLRGLQTRRSKANRILRILRLDAEDRGLRSSRTIYKKWGNGEKMRLRVSKICRSAVVGQHYGSTDIRKPSDPRRAFCRYFPSISRRTRRQRSG
jgi:hypothetical protein